MKVVIEFDLPDGQAIPSVYDITRLTSPDWHCDWWHYEDVQSVAGDLSDDEAREVLQIMSKKADANIGINWDSIEAWADWVREERKLYAFLCYDEKEEFPYGIEVSENKEGNEILDVYWFSTEDERKKYIDASPELIFIRENENA